MRGYEGRLISAMPTPVSTAVLKAVPLFASVPEEQLRMLTVVVTRKSVSRSTTVMAGGDATHSPSLLLFGRLKGMVSDAPGKGGDLPLPCPLRIFAALSPVSCKPHS